MSARTKKSSLLCDLILSLESLGDFNFGSVTLCISELLFASLLKECQSSLCAGGREILSSFSIVKIRGFLIMFYFWPHAMLSTL